MRNELVVQLMRSNGNRVIRLDHDTASFCVIVDSIAPFYCFARTLPIAASSLWMSTDFTGYLVKPGFFALQKILRHAMPPSAIRLDGAPETRLLSCVERRGHRNVRLEKTCYRAFCFCGYGWIYGIILRRCCDL